MERPKNITDQQWQTAVDIYNSAKRQGDKYPELTVAQAALETGWFKKPSGKNNYFGQKATSKQAGTTLRTTEVAGNKAYKTNDKFRDYNTIDEAVSDRIKKWGSKYQDAGNVEEAISRIWKYDSKKGQGVGYATDPEYGNKVKSILGTLGTAGLSSENNQTTSQEQPQAGYVGMLPNGLPDVYGQPYVAEEETKTETVEAPKRTDNANKLGFVADYEELSKQYEQQLQAQQKPILQQEIIEGVQYQPLQQNFQEGGTKNKVLKTTDKVAEASFIGKMLDYIPGAETVYDIKNIISGLGEGDYKKIGANTVGALLPGVSGKAFEAVAEDWLPETPEIEKKKMRFNINTSPAKRQEYLKKYGAGYLNNPQFIKEVLNKYQDGGTNAQPIFKRKGVRKNEDGTESTHLMTYAESNGKYYAYPTLFQKDDESWYELNDKNNWEALKEAKRKGEYYIFDTEEGAKKYAEGSWKENKLKDGGIKIDPQGYWNPDNEGKPVIIPSPEITMRGVDYPIYGKSIETGEVKLMTPNNNYFFANTQNVLEQPINFQIGGEFVEIDRGNGKIEKINTDSDEYRALYEEGRVLGREGDTLVNPTEFNDVTITAYRKTKPSSLEPKVQIDEQELQQRLDNPYNFETEKDGTAIIKEEVLPGIKVGQKLEDVEKVLKDTTYEQKFNTVDKANLSYSDLSSLSKEEKDKVVQQTLIENNILKQKPRNQQETATLQKELLQSGYDLGKYGVNKDGIDGQFGDKTNKALENYNNKILENGEELAINILKRKDADTFTNTLQKNDNFFTLSSDEGIKDYQKQYYDKGYFRNKQSDFNFNFSDKDLKKNYKVFSTNFIKPYEGETSCYGEECASFVTLDVLNNLKTAYGEEEGGRMFDENQVRGDAWTMNSSIVKSGGETLYNVFGKKPKNVSNVKSFVEQRINAAPKVDSKKLKAGDVVHMYYEKSGNFDKAFQEGDDIFSTHVGIVKEDEKGNLIIEHNVHGKVFKNKIEDFNNKYAKAGSSKIAITGVSRPKYNKKTSDEEKVEYIETSSVNKLNTDFITNKNSPFFKEVLPLAQESLSVNKNKILSDIPISPKEYDNLEKAIISIMWKESYGNVKVDNPNITDGNIEAYFKKALAPIAEKAFNRESSKGLTQLKDDKNINAVIKKNILNKEEDLYDPKKAAVVSLYSLSSKYLYLRDLVAKEGLKITPDELTKLAMLSWNEPIDKVGESLTKYRSFDKTWEAYNKNSTHAYSKAFSLYDKAFSKRISSM